MLVNLEDDIIVVGEAADSQEALTQIRTHRPDVVLMDVRMPGTDGVAATRAVVEEGLTSQTGQPIGVIILTTYHVDESVYAALRAGASGFLLKDAAPAEIVNAIRSVVAGEAWLDPAVARRLIDEFAARPEPNTPTVEEMAQLSAREQEVLTLFARGLSNSDAAAKLSISEATVKTHLARIMMKLGVREKAQAVAAFYQFVAQSEQAPAPAKMAELTPREREIFILVAEGLSNADIAVQLSIGEATVRTHLARVLTKLGVDEKSQAVALAYKTGLVRPLPFPSSKSHKRENKEIEEQIKERELETERKKRALEATLLEEQIRLLGRDNVTMQGFLAELAKMNVPDVVAGNAESLLDYMSLPVAQDLIAKAFKHTTTAIGSNHPKHLDAAPDTDQQEELKPENRDDQDKEGRGD
jgi:DNA-binding NarL/FixJ family response regulator